MSAEAARASFDTLPLLTSQSEIRFVWVDPHLNPKLAGNLPGSEIAEVFSHHGLSGWKFAFIRSHGLRPRLCWHLRAFACAL